MKQSASTLKKLSFELGGNAPFIVFEDADLDAAVRGLIASKFRISGQTCVCANRILVHRAVHDEFVQKVLAAVKEFQIGDGFSEGTTHGPLVHGRAVAKVHEHVKDAVAKGATLVYGGEPLPHIGANYFGVTLLTDMNPGMRICHEETFGPVAAFFTFDTDQEAIAMANDSEVGLAGYFFSKDQTRCWRVAEALEVGMVGVNVGKQYLSQAESLAAAIQCTHLSNRCNQRSCCSIWWREAKRLWQGRKQVWHGRFCHYKNGHVWLRRVNLSIQFCIHIFFRHFRDLKSRFATMKEGSFRLVQLTEH